MKGILFTELLFNKVVSKQKTQTRRAGASLAVINENPDDWIISGHAIFPPDHPHEYQLGEVVFRNNVGAETTVKPRYKAGEVAYLKEPYHQIGNRVQFKYGNHIQYVIIPGIGLMPMPTLETSTPLLKPRSFKNKLFMGADKARFFAKITDVGIERLFDISDDDCLKEGVDPIDFVRSSHPMEGKSIKKTEHGYRNYQSSFYPFETPQESYFSLYRFANSIPKSREIENVWCFVYDFVKCDKNGNEI